NILVKLFISEIVHTEDSFLLKLYYKFNFATEPLFLYVLLPILNNTIIGVQNIDSNVKEAGRSMGMTGIQLMKDVQLPLALPMILSGIRLSSVYVISWATLASYVGAGGLGDFIFNGLNLFEPAMIITATILVTLLALIVDFCLSMIEKWLVPKGLRITG
ncbi:ABC transporter permease, partial [Staphylococcus capitis]